MALSPTSPSLTTFRALAFDIFGTLIDEPTGLSKVLAPLTSQLPDSHEAKSSPAELSAAFNKHEAVFQKQDPTMSHPDVLAASYHALAKEWGVTAIGADAQAVGESVGTWPAFPDTVEAVKTLGKYYKLIPVSNVTEKGIAAVIAGPLKGIDFDAVLTAETIGSYKPDHRNFEYLMAKASELGVEKDQLLHVAQGVASDHVPAKQLGIYSAWISRNRPDSEQKYEGVGEENEGKVAFGWRWNTLGEMARDVETAFASKSD